MTISSDQDGLHEILGLCDADGRSLYECIRNGHWTSELILQVTAKLAGVRPIEFDDLTKKDYHVLAFYLNLAFTARSHWHYERRSREAESLSAFVRAFSRVFRPDVKFEYRPEYDYKPETGND